MAPHKAMFHLRRLSDNLRLAPVSSGRRRGQLLQQRVRKDEPRPCLSEQPKKAPARRPSGGKVQQKEAFAAPQGVAGSK